ncbi:hypothetical protein B0H10DRAFT_270508 [Mycena sp. CBHHK59/15]|nr:hypothetical protein B0H10DRAFT_270508 [Mycena sp. CBHHK59/15]
MRAHRPKCFPSASHAAEPDCGPPRQRTPQDSGTTTRYVLHAVHAKRRQDDPAQWAVDWEQMSTPRRVDRANAHAMIDADVVGSVGVRNKPDSTTLRIIYLSTVADVRRRNTRSALLKAQARPSASHRASSQSFPALPTLASSSVSTRPTPIASWSGIAARRPQKVCTSLHIRHDRPILHLRACRCTRGSAASAFIGRLEEAIMSNAARRTDGCIGGEMTRETLCVYGARQATRRTEDDGLGARRLSLPPAYVARRRYADSGGDGCDPLFREGDRWVLPRRRRGGTGHVAGGRRFGDGDAQGGAHVWRRYPCARTEPSVSVPSGALRRPRSPHPAYIDRLSRAPPAGRRRGSQARAPTPDGSVREAFRVCTVVLVADIRGAVHTYPPSRVRGALGGCWHAGAGGEGRIRAEGGHETCVRKGSENAGARLVSRGDGKGRSRSGRIWGKSGGREDEDARRGGDLVEAEPR